MEASEPVVVPIDSFQAPTFMPLPSEMATWPGQ